MNETIWKYDLKPRDGQEISIPLPAKILSVDEQYGRLVVWAIVDPVAPHRVVAFSIRGTGHPLDGTEGRFVNTVKMSNGLVWHVFVKD